MIWAVIENHLAVVVACAPSIKVIILLIFPRIASSLPKILSRFTRSRYSNPPNLETADIFHNKHADGGLKSPKGMLDVPSSESPLPSPMAPVFLAKWGKKAERGFMGLERRGKSEGEDDWV